MIENSSFELADSLAAEIAVVDPDGYIVRRNRKWDETAAAGMLSPQNASLNYIAECEAAGMRGCGEASEILRGLRSVLSGELPLFVANYSCPFNGRHHWFQVVITALDRGGVRRAVLMHVDVSTLQRDALTGLPNRAMFDAQLDLVLSLARESGRRTGIILVDVNRLKSINDIYGHQTGDAALIKVAEELKKTAGPDCLVARIGGDEFGVVCSVSYDTLSARRVRSHFEAGISISKEAARLPIAISASVGVALYPDDGTTASELFKSADRSMYSHKRGLSVA